MITRDYRGLKYRINSDDDFVAAIEEWGVPEQFLYAAARDLGEEQVKDAIARIAKLRDGYFRKDYGAISNQRGRLFNYEIGRLRKSQKV